MTITLGLWLIPAIITLGLLAMTFRPYQSSGDYDFGAIFRLLWLAPLGFVWAIYFAATYFWG